MRTVPTRVRVLWRKAYFHPEHDAWHRAAGSPDGKRLTSGDADDTVKTCGRSRGHHASILQENKIVTSAAKQSPRTKIQSPGRLVRRGVVRQCWDLALSSAIWQRNRVVRVCEWRANYGKGFPILWSGVPVSDRVKKGISGIEQTAHEGRHYAFISALGSAFRSCSTPAVVALVL